MHTCGKCLQSKAYSICTPAVYTTCKIDRDGNFNIVANWDNNRTCSFPPPVFLHNVIESMQDDTPEGELDIFETCVHYMTEQGFRVDEPDINDAKDAFLTQFEKLVEVETFFGTRVCDVFGEIWIDKNERSLTVTIVAQKFDKVNNIGVNFDMEHLSMVKLK